MRTPAEGADTIVWLATDPKIDTSNGIYFTDRRVEKCSRHGESDEQAARLWDVSTGLVGLG